MYARLRKRVYEIVEVPPPGDWKGRWFDRFMIVLIIANVGAVVAETVQDWAAAFGPQFFAFDVFSVAVFTVEYASRLWACVEDESRGSRDPIMVRLRYMMTPLALIDLAAILPFYLGFLFALDLRFMRVFRLLRLLKLTRYSPALATFAAVIHSQRRALGAALIIMLTLLVFAASIVHMFEREAQPEAFASIPHAMWWALATLTTVGYGDITPVTTGGRIFGSFIMILGIGMFALPTGILATGFADEIRKRNFVVNWQMVACVPLFANLDALKISEIAGLLTARTVPARFTIVRVGESADSMYFIAAGEVEIETRPLPKRLGPGGFFGEIALLKHTTRTATVVALTDCQLMVLDVGDFHRLLAENPGIESTLTEYLEERLAEIERADSV